LFDTEAASYEAASIILPSSCFIQHYINCTLTLPYLYLKGRLDVELT